MDDARRQAYWENVYGTKGEQDVSWFQDTPAPSLEMIASTGVSVGANIIDIGGGASRLVDELLAKKFRHLTVLDLSANALTAARRRLQSGGSDVEWVVADVTKWQPTQTYDLWHDRAALHFLTNPVDQFAYVERLKGAVKSEGHVIIGTFALDGPERCSGLPIVRYDALALASLLGSQFDLIDTRPHEHATPWGTVQHFQFSSFRRTASAVVSL
ncbi:class I SAM-dependent methyltransferase [Tardiphaga sp. 1201_B9_N1_1]|uniref:class I SAM-dependent methyltransferase n=1 Tax=unclassified Tardiphaga TaxID=2631404 RepID=UPI003F277A05